MVPCFQPPHRASSPMFPELPMYFPGASRGSHQVSQQWSCCIAYCGFHTSCQNCWHIGTGVFFLFLIEVLPKRQAVNRRTLFGCIQENVIWLLTEECCLAFYCLFFCFFCFLIFFFLVTVWMLFTSLFFIWLH